MTQTYRYSPYEITRAHSNKYANTEAGPSYFVPQSASHTADPPINPSVGSSEATVDAEHQNNVTEEEATPVSNSYCSYVPRVTKSAFDVGSPGAAQLRESHYVVDPACGGVRQVAVLGNEKKGAR